MRMEVRSSEPDKEEEIAQGMHITKQGAQHYKNQRVEGLIISTVPERDRGTNRQIQVQEEVLASLLAVLQNHCFNVQSGQKELI